MVWYLKQAAITVSAIHFYCKFSLKSMSSKRIGGPEKTTGPSGCEAFLPLFTIQY